MGMIFPPAVMFHSGYSYEDMVGITRYNHQKDRNSIQAENETKDRGFEDLTQRKKKTWIHQQTWWYDQGWSWPILDTLESNLTIYIYIYIYIIWRYGGFLKWTYGYPKSCMFIGFSINHPCWSTIIFETPFFDLLPLWKKNMCKNPTKVYVPRCFEQTWQCTL